MSPQTGIENVSITSVILPSRPEPRVPKLLTSKNNPGAYPSPPSNVITSAIVPVAIVLTTAEASKPPPPENSTESPTLYPLPGFSTLIEVITP